VKGAMGRPWVIKTQPDNVDQLRQTTAVLLSACSVDGGGAGRQRYSGRGESSACFFITKGTTSGISFTYGNVSFHVTFSIHLTLPSPHVHKSILHVCFSFVAL